MPQEPKVLLQRIVAHLVITHPLPWRIENDWAHEVTAVDGTIIVKCPTADEAQAFISLAEEIRKALDEPSEIELTRRFRDVYPRRPCR